MTGLRTDFHIHLVLPSHSDASVHASSTQLVRILCHDRHFISMALHARYSSFDIPASASSQPKNPDKDGIREVAFEDGRHTARMVRMATLPNGRALAGMVRKMIANDDDGLFAIHVRSLGASGIAFLD